MVPSGLVFRQCSCPTSSDFFKSIRFESSKELKLNFNQCRMKRLPQRRLVAHRTPANEPA